MKTKNEDTVIFEKLTSMSLNELFKVRDAVDILIKHDLADLDDMKVIDLAIKSRELNQK